MKIKATIAKDGTVKINTIQGAGSNCRAVADAVAKVLGSADESSRADTEDLYVQADNSTDLTTSG